MDEPDMLQGLMDGIAEKEAKEPAFEDGDFKPPSVDEILEMLKTLNISDEEKEDIRNNILNPEAYNKMFKGTRGQIPTVQYLYVAICVLILLIIFVFFGYKLYRSLTEKERKREEKKKQKQQKKKK